MSSSKIHGPESSSSNLETTAVDDICYLAREINITSCLQFPTENLNAEYNHPVAPDTNHAITQFIESVDFVDSTPSDGKSVAIDVEKIYLVESAHV